MPSTARSNLVSRIKDVNELLAAHTALTGGGKGRPTQKQGAAITRAGIVMLAAAAEAFVEELFDEALRQTYPGQTQAEYKDIERATSGRLNNISVANVEMLFLNLGMGKALREISWKKFANQTLVAELSKLVDARNKIAHGNTITYRLSALRYWKNMIERLSEKLEAKVSDQILKVSGARPNW